MPRRAAVWKDTLTEFFYDYDSKLESTFQVGWIGGCQVESCSIARVESDAMSVWRTQKHISRDGIDGFFVLLPEKDDISLSQRGHEAIVGGGAFALVSTSEAYTYLQTTRTAFDNFIIPGALLRPVLDRADERVGQALGGKPIEALFLEQATSYCRHILALDSTTRARVALNLVELLGAALDGADVASSATPVRQAHRRRIKGLIEREFANPQLGVRRIAERLNLSPRYIHVLMQEDGHTISGLITQRRLQEALRLLKFRRKSKQSVNEIAFSVGYSSYPTFCRAFRKLNGCTPSSV